MNPFENQFIQFLSAFMVLFGLFIAAFGAWGMYKNGSIGPTKATVTSEGVEISSRNPSFYIFICGLAFTLITFYLLVSGKESSRLVSLSWFFPEAYAAKEQERATFSSGWSYLGKGNEMKGWRYIFLGNSLSNLSEGNPDVIVQANTDMPVRGSPFTILTGWFTEEPAIVGYIKEGQCAKVFGHDSVGFNKVWLNLMPIKCPN